MHDTLGHSQPLLLTESHRAQIEREAIAAFPNECCGIIFGIQRERDRLVTELQPVTNAFDDSSEQFHRFSISPKDLIAAEERASERDELVLGFYHSHPDHTANPSEFDRQHAWVFYSYLIMSVSQSRAGELTCWQLNENTEQLEPQPIRTRAGKDGIT